MDDVLADHTSDFSGHFPLYNEGSHLRELLADLKTALQETGCRFEGGFPSMMARPIIRGQRLRIEALMWHDLARDPAE